MPYFSVVIPTRNRPALVVDAVNSVLEQDFSDFELIVSDNSDSAQAEETRAVLAHALTDKRVRYLRPEQVLPMADHWEWAVRQTQGTFTGVLTDRSVYRLYALRVFQRNCEQYHADLITCLTDTMYGEQAPFRIKLRRPAGPPQIVRSGEMLFEFSQCRYSKRAPRMLNSFCRTRKLHQLIEQYGSIFTGLSPDFSFCFRIMDSLDEFLSLEDRLIVVGGESQSNGFAFQTNRMNAHSQDFLAQLDPEGRWIEYGQLANRYVTIANAIAREYDIASERQISGRFRPIDRQTFYDSGMAEIRQFTGRGFDQRDALITLEEYRRAHSLSATPRSRRLRSLLRFKITRSREHLRDSFFRLSTFLMSKLSGPSRNDRPIFRAGRWCTFPSVMAALRYDARRAR